MNLRSKRRLAAEVLKVGEDRIIFDEEYSDLIQDAITRSTIRGLVGFGAIKVKPKKGISRGRVRARKLGEKRGKGEGSKEGTSFARLSRKERWVARVRALRWRLKVARDRNEITKDTYRALYSQIKGGQIRTVRQLLGMIKEARR